MTNLDRVRAYLRAIEAHDGSSLAFYAPDVEQKELPNRLVPQGATRDLAALRAAYERGKNVVSAERYEIVSAVEQGDTVALEVIWTGTVAATGATMRAYFALFITWRDGLIIRQRNYDCFEPF